MDISSEVDALIKEIRDNRTDGASHLARRAALVLKAAAEHSRAESVDGFLHEQKAVGEMLMTVRPAMAPVSNIVRRVLIEVSGGDLESVKRSTILAVEREVNDSLKALQRIAEFGSSLIAAGDKVLTHSYSSTVVSVLRAGFARHKDIEIIVTRSGPGRTGERTARELADGGVSITFIDDAAIGLYIKSASKVMLGADRVCADGAVVNGIGSCPVALAAQRAGVPVYVLCETLKFDPHTISSKVDLEEKDPSEVVRDGTLPKSVSVRNPSFDITPLELIGAIITENGLLSQEAVINYLKTLV